MFATCSRCKIQKKKTQRKKEVKPVPLASAINFFRVSLSFQFVVPVTIHILILLADEHNLCTHTQNRTYIVPPPNEWWIQFTERCIKAHSMLFHVIINYPHICHAYGANNLCYAYKYTKRCSTAPDNRPTCASAFDIHLQCPLCWGTSEKKTGRPRYRERERGTCMFFRKSTARQWHYVHILLGKSIPMKIQHIYMKTRGREEACVCVCVCVFYHTPNGTVSATFWVEMSWNVEILPSGCMHTLSYQLNGWKLR